MSILPLTPLGRIIKKCGAARVSEDAKIALSEFLKDISFEITELALKNAKENGRKTLKAEDIKQHKTYEFKSTLKFLTT